MIGLFNDCFPPIMDGVSVTTSNYAYWLNKKRGDVCVVTPNTPNVFDNYDYPIYRYLSVPIPMRKPYRLGFPRIDWPFHQKINKLSFELVHAHCPFSSGEIAQKIAKKSNIPFVATFHSKYRTDFERVVNNKYILDKMIQNIINFYASADEVWIPQAYVEDTLREYGYKGKLTIVDNGNDFSDFNYSHQLKKEAKKKLGLSSDVPLLLFVGQHIWEKNVGLILNALEKVNKKYKMLFIGSGYAESEMELLADKLGLTAPVMKKGGSKISFIGQINERKLLREYYLAADLFLFPSLYDNAPLVVREAAALHTPSLLIKGSTAAEVIEDGVNGFLSIYEVTSYANKINELLIKPDYIEKVGDCASQTITRSWRDIADEVNDRYNHLINRHKFH